MGRRPASAASLLTLFAAFLCACSAPEPRAEPPGVLSAATVPEGPGGGRPNIAVIQADDMARGDVAHMPNVRELLAGGGTTFTDYSVSLPTCCPSRVSLLRGQYAHNHRIGYGAPASADAFNARGLQASTVATWLDGQGYRTMLAGKYLNGYSQTGNPPPGWDRWLANVKRDVWADHFNDNGRETVHDAGHPDAFLSSRARAFARSSSAPFFLYLNPGAPHEYRNGPALYPRADAGLFGDEPLPESPAFNEADVSDKPPWMRDAGPVGDAGRAEAVRMHRSRLRSLQTVDRAVGGLVADLREQGELDNTYVFFTSDNGYHFSGEHRLEAGKNTPYVTDTNVPLIVRGPGVPAGETRGELVQNVDLAPTLAGIAGADVPAFVDGRSMTPLLDGPGGDSWRDAALTEGEGPHPFAATTTADGLRYVEYSEGPRELYDLEADPYQLENLLGEPADEGARAKAGGLSARLDALRSCSGASCREADGGP